MVLGFVVPWVVFVRVAREVWAGEGLPGDQRILKFLHAHATPALDTLAVGPGRWPAGDLPAGCDAPSLGQGPQSRQGSLAFLLLFLNFALLGWFAVFRRRERQALGKKGE